MTMVFWHNAENIARIHVTQNPRQSSGVASGSLSRNSKMLAASASMCLQRLRIVDRMPTSTPSAMHYSPSCVPAGQHFEKPLRASLSAKCVAVRAAQFCQTSARHGTGPTQRRGCFQDATFAASCQSRAPRTHCRIQARRQLFLEQAPPSNAQQWTSDNAPQRQIPLALERPRLV